MIASDRTSVRSRFRYLLTLYPIPHTSYPIPHTLVAFFLVIVTFAASAQSRSLIMLKDKRGTSGTIANPSGFLSPRAVERRTKQHIQIDSSDLPVSAAYLQAIAAIPNVVILNVSKWLNQVCIRTTDAQALITIKALPFVKNTFSLAPRLPGTGQVIPFSPEPVTASIPAVNRLSATTANSLNYGNTIDQIHIHNGEYLHNQGFSGTGVHIAILDAGFFGYKTNPAFDSVRLQNRVLGEWDFVANEASVNEDNSHGMYCFSIMATNRPGAMVGSAPHAAFYLYRTEDAGSEYLVEEQNWVAAAERADSAGADMISSSLGYADFDNPVYNHTFLQRNGNTAIITIGADLAAKKGMIVMNSAGNSGAETGDAKFIACPADGDSVVAVGAVDINGRIAAFSSWGPNGAGKRKPNIVSVGQGTIIAGLDGSVSAGSGTSYANPNMAGLIACLWQAFPAFSNMQIMDAVQQSADRHASPDDRYGYGIPDFKKAFSILAAKSFKGQVTPVNCSGVISWSGTDNETMHYDLERRSGTETSFQTIASIKGKSRGFTSNNYTFTDALVSSLPAAYQYRIKQFLVDTTIIVLDTSFTVPGNCSATTGIAIAPNPFMQTINVRVQSRQSQKMSISLYSPAGQRLYYYETQTAGGLVAHTIPASGLAAGMYIITVRDNRKVLYSGKVVKGK